MTAPLTGAAKRLFETVRAQCGTVFEALVFDAVIRDVIAEAKAEEREACAEWFDHPDRNGPGVTSLDLRTGIRTDLHPKRLITFAKAAELIRARTT